MITAKRLVAAEKIGDSQNAAAARRLLTLRRLAVARRLGWRRGEKAGGGEEIHIQIGREDWSRKLVEETGRGDCGSGDWGRKEAF